MMLDILTNKRDDSPVRFLAYWGVAVLMSILVIALALNFGLTTDGAELALYAICTSRLPILPKLLDFVFFDLFPVVVVVVAMAVTRPSSGVEAFVRFFNFIDRFLTRTTSPSLPPPRQNLVPRLVLWAGTMPV